MTRGFCPSALGLMDNAQNIAIARDFRKCEKYLTLPEAMKLECWEARKLASEEGMVLALRAG